MSRIYTWVITTLAPLLILLVGAGGVWSGGGYLILACQSAWWPHAEGTITRSEVQSEGRFERGADTESFWPEVEYEYTVEGKSLRSNAISLNGLRNGPRVGSAKRAAEEFVERHPIGTTVAVYYDPQSPERATLQAGVTASNFFVPGSGMALILLALVWLGWLPIPGLGRTGSGTDAQYAGMPRQCPKCQTEFTSVQDKGSCPSCGHVFFASD